MGRTLHRLERPRAQLVAALVVGWLPVVVLGAIGSLFAGRVDPLLRDASVHVRLLVAVPLLRVAELMLARQARTTLARLGDEGFVPDDERARFARLVARDERLRSARVPSLIFVVVALFFGVAMLAGWPGGTGVVNRATVLHPTLAYVWFDLVALPLFIFLLQRALWRWVVWVATLVGVARLPLTLAPGHPDRRGGLAFVTLPSLAFHAPFLFAVGAVLAAGWGMQLAGGATLQQFRSLFLAFLALGELSAFAPLVAFTPRLFLARRRDLVEYGALATDYARRFHGRWIARTTARDELLGTPDLQSLNDLATAFRESIERTSPIAFGARELVALAIVMVVPTLPLFLAALPLDVLLARLGKLLLGAR